MNNSLENLTRHPPPSLNIAVVVLDGFDFASLSSILEAISSAKRNIGSEKISVSTIGIHSPLASSLGIKIVPNLALTDVQLSEFHVTILIGGSAAKLTTHSELSLQLIDADKSGRLMGGVWNGAYHLAAAGLTAGYECLITGDGRFAIEPTLEKRKRHCAWHFDERRMTSGDSHSTTCMMNAMIVHYFQACNDALQSIQDAGPQDMNEGLSFPEAC
ncbi:DJ-1/PfpI family protein [Pseudomonas sp. CC120222-01a]|uniref:DJ-1/PfpI family protein n=1 Tax=Pseudomonas sp. CC120222-01a TaxID=1378075 RepID=UPI000D9BB381|nr:DJ-1/PfpI family protein [Pseudomonas sp. CC120222-01a]PVZ42536.1 DJ-1/PfpI family protein [Pseudomonas sp. CC120222-01a]